jgi:hypothetical protein
MSWRGAKKRWEAGGPARTLRRRLKGPSVPPGGLAAALVAACLAAALPAAAQYVGKVSEGKKEAPELRSIAVLEWTGEAGSPKTSRLVPVAVLDAGQLQDGGVYLARPEPLALGPQVEYQLQQDGQPIGLFDIRNAGQQDGSWVGFGAWKPMPSAKPKLTAKELAKVRLDGEDDQSDTPVLHRKRHADDKASSGGTGSGGTGSGSGDAGGQSAPSDPDRPTLHKKDESGGSWGGSGGQAAGQAGGQAGGQTGDQASGQEGSDPDRPVLKKPRPPAKTETASAAEAGSDAGGGDSDPDRPRLRRGKASSDSLAVAPTLKGFPADVQQTVAVSDAKTQPPHPWKYAWANPDDEAKMKTALEQIARAALNLNPPAAAPVAKTAAGRAAAARKAKAAAAAEPVPLPNEEFQVFELAYGSGATMVLSAHTEGPAAQQKFVTIVAQPDLYGNALVLLKSVTDGAHLDDTPRMRLVDAVDAMADNRGELLFELRGATQRQFALYRVLRGQAEKLFVTGGGEFSAAGGA